MEEDQELSKRERKKLNREKKRETEVKSEQQSGLFKKLGFIAIVVIGAFFLWTTLQSGNKTDNDSPQNTVSLERVATDQVKGNPQSDVVLYEYADFQCPGCASFVPVLKAIEAEYGDRIAIVFRHFPLKSIHPNASIAGQAAEAAGNQGKFWEMHDLLFENQSNWSGIRDPKNEFISYAEQLELDLEKFEADMYSEAVKNIVNDSYNQGIVLGVNSTPSVFINNKPFDLRLGTQALREEIELAIENASPTETEIESSDSAEVQE